MDWQRYRDLFPITKEYIYLNNAASSPMPAPVADALREYVDQMQHVAMDRLFEKLLALVTETTERAAQLINAARADEIVQVHGTATGINIAAKSLPLRAGDNVLLLEGDYPAVIYPWLNMAPQGIMTKFVPTPNGGLDLNLLESRIDRRTRCITVSTVMFATGFRNDMEAMGKLCRERGIFLVVDAIQSLGYLPVDVQAWNVDFLASGSHKWLLAPPGTGILYCRHDLLDELQPGAYVGALSVAEPFNFSDINFTLAPSSARFGVSAGNFMGTYALHAAFGLLQEIGIERIAERVLSITRTLIDDLESRGFRLISNTEDRHRSGIVMVEVPDPVATYQALGEANVIAAVRGKGLRLSPHFYNTPEEMCRVGEILEAHQRAPSLVMG